MIFDIDEPPQTYKDFKNSVMGTIEDTEIESDERYPGALFIVGKEGTGDVVHLDDLAAEEDDEDMTLEDIIFEKLPDIVRQNESKYFAFVFSGEKQSEGEDSEIVVIISGDLFHTDMVLAEVNREYEYAELEPWQKEDHMPYSSLVVPLRQAVTWQG